MQKIAVIDLGSNSVRMNIAEKNDNHFQSTHQFKEMVRLSEGMGEDSVLRIPAMWRAFSALKKYSGIISEHKPDKVIAVATAAVRAALNGQYFIDEVKRGTGLEIEVIPGEKEAYYDFLGVVGTLEISDCVIIDIGGGSTELILVREKKMQGAVSLPFGAVNLTEKFLNNDESVGLVSANEYILSEINKIEWIEQCRDLKIVGLGGSTRSVGKVNLKSLDKGTDVLHGHIVSRGEFDKIYANVLSLPASERKKIKGIGEERGDIILGGMLPLKILLEKIDSPQVILSTGGLREGIMFEAGKGLQD